MTAAPEIVVHCVHGTFPRGALRLIAWNVSYGLQWLRARGKRQGPDALFPTPNRDPAKRYWFESGSHFERAVREHLGIHSQRVRFERVLWSGNNSFAAREQASRTVRAHLIEQRRRFPDARHLVLAHSHGGTAAAAALDVTDPPHERVANGLMTLGTPFVRLAYRGVDGKPGNTDLVVALVLPLMTLFVAPLFAADLAARAMTAGVLSAFVVALSVVALAAAAARHVGLAAITLLVTYFAGDAGFRSDLLALGLLAFLPALWLATRSTLFERNVRLVQSRAIHLPCRLLALRTPNDEAGLVIGLAQTAERVFRLAAGAVESVVELLARRLRGFAARGSQRRLLRRAVVAVCVAVTASVLVVINDLVYGVDERTWWEFLLLALYLPGVLFATAAVAFVLAWLVPGIALSFAAGRESLALPALAGVDAEPLPFAYPESAMTLIIDVEAARATAAGLNHSLHELPAIRLRVAKWIHSHFDERNEPFAHAPSVVDGDSRVLPSPSTPA